MSEEGGERKRDLKKNSTAKKAYLAYSSHVPSAGTTRTGTTDAQRRAPSPRTATIKHARMLMHRQHPCLVHPRAVPREPKLRQLRLRRAIRRRGVLPPQLGQIVLPRLVVRLLVMRLVVRVRESRRGRLCVRVVCTWMWMWMLRYVWSVRWAHGRG